MFMLTQEKNKSTLRISIKLTISDGSGKLTITGKVLYWMPQYSFLPARLLAGCEQHTLINSKGLAHDCTINGKWIFWDLLPLPIRTTKLTVSFRKDVHSPRIIVKSSYSLNSFSTNRFTPGSSAEKHVLLWKHLPSSLHILGQLLFQV